MARISFSALIESITGKLAGSVFQDSYGGFQIRTRVSPRNPQTNYQQLRRGEFGFISALWRNLTTLQRQSFIDASSTPPAALNLFIQANVNLTLIEEPIISTYNVTTAPILFPLQINDLSPSTFIIQASSGTVIVPTGTKLLVFSTTDRGATQVFTNPSAFTPLLNLDEGTDLSIPLDIISDWDARFGVMRSNRNLCIKSVLIDKSNGNRGTESIICQISSTPILMQNLQQTLDAGNTADQTLTLSDGAGNETQLFEGEIDLTDAAGNAISLIASDGFEVIAASGLLATVGPGLLTLGNGTVQTELRNDLNTNSGVVFKFPNIATGNHTLATISTADNFINDASAAAGGIVVGQLYHTAGTVKVRLV